ncbi:LOW QUALITY PROTEIN: actin-like protein 10 [Podargus strigoides]
MPKPAVITDNGSSFIWPGFTSQKSSKLVLRTMLLHPCGAGVMQETQQHPTIAESTAGFTTAPRTYPLKHGIMEDWDTMENLWNHLFFCGLKALPEEQPVLMASLSCPSTNREKVVEVLFKSYRVPALHVANTGFLSHCAYSRVTSLAVEAGAGTSHVTSICLGQTWREATHRLGVAGDFTSLLMESLREPSVLKALKRKTAIQLKKQCYVSTDYKGDLHNQNYHYPARFQAPDRHWITLDKERFCFPEPLFQPKLPGLYHFTLQSPHRARRDMVGNIVLSGGSSMFPGFPKRELELNALFPSTGCQNQVLASLERGTAAWAEGSMAALLTSFQHMWMAKGNYQEHSAEYMHKIFHQEDDSHAMLTVPGQGAGAEPQRCRVGMLHMQSTAAQLSLNSACSCWHGEGGCSSRQDSSFQQPVQQDTQGLWGGTGKELEFQKLCTKARGCNPSDAGVKNLLRKGSSGEGLEPHVVSWFLCTTAEPPAQPQSCIRLGLQLTRRGSKDSWKGAMEEITQQAPDKGFWSWTGIPAPLTQM